MTSFLKNLQRNIAAAEKLLAESKKSSISSTGAGDFTAAREHVETALSMQKVLDHLNEALKQANKAQADQPNDFTPGAFYDIHLLRALKKLGGEAKLSQVQQLMIKEIKHLLKSQDFECAPRSNRKRVIALSASRVKVLAQRGLIVKSGSNLVIPASKS